jgi:carboxyl-terminal processing protease
LGFGAYRLWERTVSREQAMGVFWEAWDHVADTFYGELPSATERTYGAIRAALALLGDPHTVFIEPAPRELERDRMRGLFGGIGVDLWRDADGRVVLSPYPDSPAEQAGILQGDILLAVDSEEITKETTIDEVKAWLHGEVDTTVILTLSRSDPDADSPTPPLEIAVTRAEIRVPSVTWRMLDQGTDAVGYIHITNFTERTGEETVSAIEDLESSGATGLVLDLRDNYGGLVNPAVNTASQFLADGVVMYEHGRDSERALEVQDGGIALDTPLVVLVNSGTASAAEIVAGALQGNGRAALIGETTFGKGSVQLIYELSDGSSLHVTSAVWLTPDRRQIQGQGLLPDVEVPRGDGTYDAQLERAVEYLKSQP